MEIRLSECIAPAFYGLHADLRAGKYAEYFLKGGRGSGKSSFVSLEIVLGLLKNPEANAIVFRRVGATLRESAYEQLRWAIETLGLADLFEFRLSIAGRPASASCSAAQTIPARASPSSWQRATLAISGLRKRRNLPACRTCAPSRLRSSAAGAGR